jgi:hypothetical protein
MCALFLENDVLRVAAARVHVSAPTVDTVGVVSCEHRIGTILPLANFGATRTGTEIQLVVSASAEDRIVAGLASEVICAVTAADIVDPTSTSDRVIASQPVEYLKSRISPVDDVAAWAAGVGVTCHVHSFALNTGMVGARGVAYRDNHRSEKRQGDDRIL